MTNEPTNDKTEQAPTPYFESTGDPALDELTSKPVFNGHVGVDAAQVWMSAFLIIVAGIIAYSTVLTIPLYDYAGTFAARPGAVHGVSLALHLANAALLFMLFRAFTRDAVAPVVGMVAGLIFALHPAATQSVDTPTGLPGIVSTTFVLLSLLFFVRATRQLESVRLVPYVVSIAAFVAACFFAPQAIVLPLLVIGIDFALHGENGIASRLKLWGPFVAVLVTLLAANMAAGAPCPIEKPDLYVFLEYVRLLVLPTNLSLVHAAPAAVSIVGIIAVVLLVALAAVMRSLAAVAVAWVALALLVAAGTGSSVREEQMYLAIAGAGLLIPWMFSRIRPQPIRVAAGLAIAALVFIMGGATIQRNTIWHDGVTLWSDAVAKTSGKQAAAWAGLGRAYLARAQVSSDPEASAQARDEAIRSLKAAAAMRPDDHTLVEDLGITLVQAGQADEALALFKNIVRQDINNHSCLIQIGDLMMAASEDSGPKAVAEALQYYKRADSLQPLTGATLTRYAMALVSIGDTAAAEPLLMRAIEQEPAGNESASLKAVLKKVQENLTQARSLQQQAMPLLAKNSSDPKGLKLQAQSLVLMSDVNKAVLVLAQIQRTSVPDYGTWLLAGFVWAKRNETSQFIHEWKVPPSKPSSAASAWTDLATSCAASGMWEAAFAYLDGEPARTEGIADPQAALEQIANALKHPLPDKFQNGQ